MWNREREAKPLFIERDGHEYRQVLIEAALREVAALPEARLREETDDELVSAIIVRNEVVVPALDKNEISYDRKQRTVERQDYFGRVGSVEVSSLDFEVPFSGNEEIFKVRPNRFDSMPPRAVVERGKLKFSVVEVSDPAQIKREVDSTLSSVESYLGWHQDLWAGFGEEIARAARQAIAQRRAKMEAASRTDDGLSALGFKPKPR